MIRVAKPGTRIFIGDEAEELAIRYEKLPGILNATILEKPSNGLALSRLM
jgi:hypothetical protein